MSEVFVAGGPVMYPLLICSIIALAVIVDRSIIWIRYEKTDGTVSVAELCRIANSDKPSFPDETKRNVVLRVLRLGLESRSDKSSWSMRQAAAAEVTRMGKHLGILSTMVSLAPLLGIFGTVLGIIESFQLTGNATLADPAAATGGLAKALITTAFGLGIAMPSLIAFKLFDSKTLRFKSELETRCTELEWRLGLASSESLV